ncbi:MAG: hypothetical protein V4549_07500 [Bacteroidota bacterium]
MKESFKTIGTTAIALILCVLITAAVTPNSGDSKKDVKVFVSNNMLVIEANILAFSKLGYSVNAIESQSLTFKVDGYKHSCIENESIVKSDIILIMEK